MNRQIRRLGIALVGCYAALFVMLNYWQVIGASDLNEHPRNTRAIVRDFNAPRGTIATADEVLLAQSVPTDGGQFEQQRVYLEPELYAHVTGYYAFTIGATGVEREYNEQLAGRTLEIQLRSLGDFFIDRDRVGNLTLSLRHDLQEVARAALGAQEGSVVALDPRTGAILAMWSFPSFDPNVVSSHDLSAATEAKQALEQAPGQPLLAHTYQDRYFPGSTFKIVTASAGLRTGAVSADSPVYPSVTGYTPPLTDRPISNFGGSVCGGTLPTILARSCNSSFAQMAVDVGPTAMIEAAQAYGFNEVPPLDLPDPIESVFPTDYERNTPALAQAGIGQFDVQATPLEMALVVGAVANEGVLMAPTVLSEIRDSGGRLVEEAQPSEWHRPLDAAQAAVLRDAMVATVEGGTATALAIPGVEVGGKTGTAQIAGGSRDTHAWIVGFAGPPGETAHVAVSVFVKAKPGGGEQTGGRVAAPIARAVLERAVAD